MLTINIIVTIDLSKNYIRTLIPNEPSNHFSDHSLSFEGLPRFKY